MGEKLSLPRLLALKGKLPVLFFASKRYKTCEEPEKTAQKTKFVIEIS